MKISVIGCTHAGTAAVTKILEKYKDAEVSVFERNDNISFLSCGIALYVGGDIKDPNGLFYSSPKALENLGAKVNMEHDVTDVDFKNKVLTAKNLVTGEIFTQDYDKLIITTGSWPIIPNFEGVNLNNILLCKNYNHSKKIIELSKDKKNITIVGGGYIGIELAEAFRKTNKNVRVIDLESRIMSSYFDKEYTDIAENELKENGIFLSLNEKVSKFEGDNGNVTHVITDKGTYETDFVILSLGFKPNTKIFEGKLDMLQNGAIIVDEYMHTSEKDVFAAGDATTVYNNAAKKNVYAPLATNAVRTGALVAMNLLEDNIKSIGTQGSSGIKIYSQNMASTGLTSTSAKKFGIDSEEILVKENYRPEFMDTYYEVMLKIVYDKNTRKIIGGQVTSIGDYTNLMTTVSIAIYKGLTIDELAFVDIFFQPHYNKPWNILNVVGQKA